jgi:hypothetical protein
MHQNDGCVICELPDQPTKEGSNVHAYRTNCERCGSYEVSPMEEGFSLILALPPEVRPIVSEWTYEQNRLGEVPTISGGNVNGIANRRKLMFADRTRRLLVYLAANTPNPGLPVAIRARRIQAMLQTYYEGYVDMIILYLKDEGLISYNLAPTALLPDIVALTPKGLMQAEEWGGAYAASTQGFVAMWFADEMKAAWEEGFYTAIDSAGYAPRRIDNREHINKICDEIIAEIRRSRFIVADFTGQRGGVYYEAGYARGRDIPVIWTCRRDWFDKLHFDIRQYNCIDWDTPKNLAQRLRVRIQAVIGDGPLRHRQ